MKYFGKLLVAVCLLGNLWACQGQEARVPEPHLELGQRIFFVGGQPEQTYVVAGYRHYLEDKTEKDWQDQEYIVFTYINQQGDVKEATVHRNAILKR